MTIIDFALLTTTEQLHMLYTHGVFLCKRSLGHKHIILYQYNKLYVEIHYEKYRHTVDRIRCSEETDILLPYLDSIHIDQELFSA